MLICSRFDLGEEARRGLDQVGVAALAELERRGTFGERGYRSSAAALADLLGWERADAKRHLSAAEHVGPRVGLDGTPLPPRLPATAAAFEAGVASVRHVEVVARVSVRRGGPARSAAVGGCGGAARRVDPRMHSRPSCRPAVASWWRRWMPTGPSPTIGPSRGSTSCTCSATAAAVGGRLGGRFDDAAMFDAIATLVDAQAAPRTAEDDRTAAQRQAEALADACGWMLDHGDTVALSRAVGGARS